MADNKSNFFNAEAERIKAEHDAKEAALTNTPAAQEVPKEDLNKIIRVNISLSKAYHNRLQDYAKRKCIPVSMLIRNWIDEHCD